MSRTPFEKLMRLVAALDEEDWHLALGALAERWDEPVPRIADALAANRVLQEGQTAGMPDAG